MVVGSGGRCHAIVKALSKSEKVTRIYAAPGNDGMSELATLIPISATNVSELLAFAKIENMDLFRSRTSPANRKSYSAI